MNMETEADLKFEEIQKDKDWFDDGGEMGEPKNEEKPKKVDPDGKCDIKFEIITKFFQKINDSKGRKKGEFLERFFKEYLFSQYRKQAFAYLRLILPHVTLFSFMF